MLKRGITIAFLVICTLVLSFSAGYFFMDGASKKTSDNKSSDIPLNETAIAKTGDHKGEVVINENTKIKTTYIYIKGNRVEDYQIAVPEKETIGLSKTEAEKYFSKKGFILQSFSKDEVAIQKVITDKEDLWPPDKFIMISDNDGNVILYDTDKNGKLTNEQKTEYNIDSLPGEDGDNLRKGRIFSSEETRDEYIAENFET